LAEDRLRGQVDLFGAASADGELTQSLPDAKPWTRSELASREKAAIGFYLSTHPLDDFQHLLSGLRLKNIAEHAELQSGQVVKLAGMITGLQVRTSKRGNRFAQFRFEDRSAGLKGVVLGDNFNKLSPLLADDGLFIAEGNIEAPEGQEPTLKINSLQSLKDAESSSASEVRITLPPVELSDEFFEGLYRLLERDRGRSSVVLNMCVDGAQVMLRSDGLAVNGSRSLQTDLEAKGCSVEWVG
jgi:DNA polymerase-3 subunit alpha